MSETTAIDSMSDVPARGFFAKLANGDYGLAKTYWLYWVAVGHLAALLSSMITSTVALLILMAFGTAYDVLVVLGIWRAANRYEGPAIWPVLAKISIVLGVLITLLGWAVMVWLLCMA